MIAALTGGIGAGKSTTLEYFKQFGCAVYDTDEMVHQLYSNSTEFRNQILEHWNLSASLDLKTLKQKIAEIVFTERDELIWLESIIHPLIQESLLKIKQSKSLAICAVPLLFETKMESLFDLVITVSCSEQEQMKRLQARGWNKLDIEGRLKRQLSMTEKENRADLIVSNCGSLAFLKKQCELILLSHLTK